MNREEHLKKCFALVLQVREPLASDINEAIRRLRSAVVALSEDRGELQEVCFWGKVATSSLLAQMDAMGYVMRQAVLLSRRLDLWTLSSKEQAKLSSNYLSSLEGFKLGVKHFAALVGIDFTLRTGDRRWRDGVLALAAARHRFTHPQRIEDVFAVEMFGSLRASLVWFYSELIRLAAACGKSWGEDEARLSELSAEEALEVLPQSLEQRQLFTDEEMGDLIEKDSGRTLGYARQFLQVLRFDGHRVAVMRRRVLASRKRRSKVAGFAARVMLRTECSQIEAVMAATLFLLGAARDRGEIHFDDAALEPAEGYPKPIGKLVSAANVWSREMGTGQQVAVSEGTRDQLVKAWERRDRLHRPRSPRDLQMTPEGIQTQLGALLELEVAAFGCLEVDVERVLAAYRRSQAPTG